MTKFIKLGYELIPDKKDCCLLTVNMNDENFDKFIFNLEHLFEWVENFHYYMYIKTFIINQYKIDYNFKIIVDGTFEEFIFKLKKIYLT